MTVTVGVDLAASDAKTATAALAWSPGGARLLDVAVGASDADVVRSASGAEAVGIDCALGWPREFVEFLTAYRNGAIPPREVGGAEWRRRLSFRETDRVVREVTGRWPLSAATDRLGVTALRCAELLAAFEAEDGRVVDRSGAGRHAEVYPAAALRIWGLYTAGYKVREDAREELLARLLERAPWLEVSAAQRRELVRTDHALDAVLAALNARAHRIGATLEPPAEHRELAREEGWVALPTGPLEGLDPRG